MMPGPHLSKLKTSRRVQEAKIDVSSSLSSAHTSANPSAHHVFTVFATCCSPLKYKYKYKHKIKYKTIKGCTKTVFHKLLVNQEVSCFHVSWEPIREFYEFYALTWSGIFSDFWKISMHSLEVGYSLIFGKYLYILDCAKPIPHNVCIIRQIWSKQVYPSNGGLSKVTFSKLLLTI